MSRNPIARSLRSSHLRQQVVEDPRRDEESRALEEELREELEDFYNSPEYYSED